MYKIAVVEASLSMVNCGLFMEDTYDAISFCKARLRPEAREAVEHLSPLAAHDPTVPQP